MAHHWDVGFVVFSFQALINIHTSDTRIVTDSNHDGIN